MTISKVEIIDFPGTHTVVARRDDLPLDSLVEFMDETFTALAGAIEDGKFVPAGPGFTRYNSEFSTTVSLEAGFPVEQPFGEFLKVGDVTIFGSGLPSGRTAISRYRGGYDGLSDAWSEFVRQVKERGFGVGTPIWEAYDVAPLPGVREDELVTGLAAPVRRS